MGRSAPLVAAVLLASAPCARAAGAAPAAGDPWQEDFAALLTGLAASYANFEYTLTDRRIDLPALATRGVSALQGAADDERRRHAFEALLRDLRDPHVWIDWAPGASGGADPACPRALAEEAVRSGMRWERLAGFRPSRTVHGKALRAGVHRAPGHRPLGVVRIGLFSERAFAGSCRAAAEELSIDPDAPCDAACESRLAAAAGSRLNRALEQTLRELTAEGVERIVVDVTGNGGGSDWVESALRIVGGRVRSPRVGMLRHPAWERHLVEAIEEMDGAMAAGSRERQLALTRARARAAADLEAVRTRCDLGAAWTDRALAQGERPLPCSTLRLGSLRSSGFEAAGPPPPAAEHGAAELLFVPRRFGAYRERAVPTPIAVLVDAHTHSAAELFAAALQDGRRALVVGGTTAGAGCGQFTRLGSSFVLPRSGARVHVPDCVRLRADGTSERRGVIPDRFVPWGPSDSALQAVEKAVATLQRR